MKLYVLDFESYWDQDYTLKKLTTDGYVLDPRFKTHGLGIRWPSGQLEWVRGPDIPAALQRIDWANAAVCAHNTAFDGFILTQRYGCPQPKWWLDTMSMARGVFGPDVSASLKEVAGRLGLGVKGDAVEQTKGLTVLPPDVEASLAEYCLNDVELCYRVLAKLRSRVPAIEMKLIDLTLRMFVRPRVWLDERMLEQNLRTEVQRKDELMARLGVTKAQLNSADQLAKLFARMGVKAPTKPSPKDPKKRIYAFAKNDPEFQELLEDERDEVRWLAEARLGVRSTIEESRTGRLLQVAKDERPWPVLLHYYGAHTGRWSGGNKCLLGSAEVLTLDGWERLDSVRDGAPVLTWSAATGELGWEAAQVVRVEHDGELIRLASVSGHHDCTYTPDHRTATASLDPGAPLREHSAEQLVGMSDRRLPVAGRYEGGASPITVEEARVLAMLQADGHVYANNGLSFRFRKGRKVERCRELLGAAGFEFSAHKRTAGFVEVYVRVQSRLMFRPYKRLGPWLLELGLGALDAFVDETRYWDGYARGESWQFATSVESNARWLQIAAHLTGRFATVQSKANAKGYNARNDGAVIFNVNVRPRDYLVLEKDRRIVEKPRFSGSVYCLTTKRGGFMVRSNGNVFLTLNCNPQNLGRKSVLRQSITAPKGYVIGVADSSQIECRITARVSGQQSLLDIFRAKGDPYSTFASKPFRRIVTKADKLERQVGKVCLTGDTLVITNRGIVPLLTVSRKDLVWDGREWVSHGGLVCNGEMPVLRAWGIGATAEHEILTEHGWREWSEVRTSRRLFRSALRSATSPSSTGDDTSHPAAGTTGTTRSAGASAGGRGLWKRPACDRDEARSATPARESLQLASVSGSTRARCPTTRTEFACSIDSRQRSLAATTHATRRTATMESVASSWPKSGVAIAQRFSATCKRFLAGMTQILRWIGRTSTGAMCPATSASSLAGRTSRTSGASPISNSECVSSRQSSPVFDLVNCGPRNRFTVLSTEGPIVVHNCILGFGFGMGWAKATAGFSSGAITQGYGPIVFDRAAAETFGADPRWLTKPQVQDQLRTIPKTISLKALAVHALAVNMLVSMWRAENPFTVNYWYYLNDLIPHMAAGGRATTDFFTIEAKGVTLPNGMRIEYHGLRERGGDWFYLNRRKPTKLYGGKMLENVVQALARIVVAEQMVRIAERYETVMMTHDEVVFLMPEREADEGMQWALDIMHTPPRWMPDLPVAAEGGYAARYADAKS